MNVCYYHFIFYHRCLSIVFSLFLLLIFFWKRRVNKIRYTQEIIHLSLWFDLYYFLCCVSWFFLFFYFLFDMLLLLFFIPFYLHVFPPLSASLIVFSLFVIFSFSPFLLCVLLYWNRSKIILSFFLIKCIKWRKIQLRDSLIRST